MWELNLSLFLSPTLPPFTGPHPSPLSPPHLPPFPFTSFATTRFLRYTSSLHFRKWRLTSADDSRQVNCGGGGEALIAPIKSTPSIIDHRESSFQMPTAPPYFIKIPPPPQMWVRCWWATWGVYGSYTPRTLTHTIGFVAFIQPPLHHQHRSTPPHLLHSQSSLSQSNRATLSLPLSVKPTTPTPQPLSLRR